MAFANLKDFVDLFETGRNELIEIDYPVSPHLEMTEITDRVSKNQGPAVLFTNPAGYKIPVFAQCLWF